MSKSGAELIKNYKSAVTDLAKYFDQTWLIFDIEDFTEFTWSFADDSLTWFENSVEYFEEASFIASTKEHSLYLVYSCTGDKHYAILDNLKEFQNE